MKTEILIIMKKTIKDYLIENTVIETLCSLCSNITFRNEEFKKKIGDVGLLDLLLKTFFHYS